MILLLSEKRENEEKGGREKGKKPRSANNAKVRMRAAWTKNDLSLISG